MVFRFLKSRLFGAVATFAIFATAIGLEPASVLFFYQPEVPKHLRD